MKDQYAGDISDLLKFAFLRALSGADRTLGIAWYYTSGDDGRPDGHHIEWREDEVWRTLDPEVYDGLSRLTDRTVIALERLTMWPTRCHFHSEPVPPRPLRQAWATRMREALDSADLVFLDPDNGLGSATPKHATFEEVNSLRRPGRALVFITFPGRSQPHDVLVNSLHLRLHQETNTKSVVTVRTNISVPSARRSGSYVQRQRWFTIIDPDASLAARADTFARSLRCLPRTRAKVDRWARPEQ